MVLRPVLFLALAGCPNIAVYNTTDTGEPTDTGTDTIVGPVDADQDGFLSDIDCDDTNASIFPRADEICDGLDNDCDGLTDDDDDSVDLETARPWYADVDEDGFGNPDVSVVSCSPPPGAVAEAGDCNDASAAIRPDATEVCDTIDNDCDELVDDDDDSVDLSTGSRFFADVDEDTYGDPTAPTTACAQPTGTVTNDLDCNDGDAAIQPDATEVCDTVDNDCDALVDDADDTLDPTIGGTLFYSDADGDGFGDPESGSLFCVQPPDLVDAGTDCNDGDGTVYPGATELCDDQLNDCDGSFDEAGLATWTEDGQTPADYTTNLTGTSGSEALVELRDSGELRICAGTWYANIVVLDGADVTIEGAGRDLVMIEGVAASPIEIGGADSVVSVQSLTAMKSGTAQPGIDCSTTGVAHDVTITDVDVRDNADLDRTGAVHADGCDLTLDNVDITDNTGGPGLYFANGTLDVDGGLIDSNISDVDGGGVYLDGGAVATFDDVNIANNKATSGARNPDGGGVVAWAGADVTITNSLIEDNEADGEGGGLLVVGTATLADTDLVANTADQGGGLYVAGGFLEVTGGTIEETQQPGREEVASAGEETPPPVQPEGLFAARVVLPDGTPVAGWKMVHHDRKVPRIEDDQLILDDTTRMQNLDGLREMLRSPQGRMLLQRQFGDRVDEVIQLLEGAAPARPTVETDAAGRFAFAFDAEPHQVRVERDGFMVYGSGRLQADGELLFVVGPCVDVKGHVTDANGRALEGVYFSMGFELTGLPGIGQQLQEGGFRSWNGNSHSDGSFSLGVVPQHPALHVSASKQGYKGLSTFTTEIRGPVRWQLEKKKAPARPKVLRGIVRLPDGSPAPKARVQFGSSGGFTDDSGRFELPLGYVSGNVSLTAYLAGHQLAVRRGFSKALKQDPELATGIVLELGGKTLAIDGRVLDADGKPLRGSIVMLADGVSAGNSNQWTETLLGKQSNKGERTDRSGAFSLRGLSDRPYNVRVIDEKLGVVLESGPVAAGTGDLVLRVPADAHRRLEGVVVDSHGNPIAGAEVELVTPKMQVESGTYYHNFGDTHKTDAAGRFVIERCPRRFAHVWLDGDMIDSERLEVPADDAPMRIVVPRMLRLSLRVTSGLGATHFAILDAKGQRLKTSCRMPGVRRALETHPIVVDNAPYYVVPDTGTELLLRKGKEEVGRIPLNLRAGVLNTVDV